MSRLATGLAGPSAALLLAAAFAMPPAQAHGVVGNRFLVASLLVEDPFVADELSVPTFSSLRQYGSEDEAPSRESEISVEWAKTVTPDFGISFEQAYVIVNPRGERTQRGFDNLGVGFKYMLVKDPASEFVLSVGADFDVGGWGSKRIGAESFWSVTPTVYFGKGLGDIGIDFVRPLGITGSVGVNLPFRRRTATTSYNPDTMEYEQEVERHYATLEWGFTLQYSLSYLQANVHDIGLGAPFDRLVPIVEMAFETPLGGPDRKTTGTVNPGLIWTGQSVQFGLEAQLPINRASGKGVGVLMQVHLYLDDIFPDSLGKPILGGRQMSKKIVAAVIVALGMAPGLAPGLAWAHAQLQRAEPKVGSAGPAPQKVQLWFSEAIEPALSKAVVKDADGKEVDAAPGGVAAEDRHRIDVAVPALPPGSYRVEWSVVSVDGHKTSGNFTFMVK